jgi:mannose-6-phosphate isomerase-like protein (cupin superfamily)
VKACRAAGSITLAAWGGAMATLFAMNAIVSCGERGEPEVPPVTTAKPGAAPVPGPATVAIASDASPATMVTATPAEANAMLAAPLQVPKEPPIKASFVDAPGNLDAPICSRVLVAVVKGKIAAMGETLAPGDVLVVTYPDPVKLEGAGLAVVARRDFEPDTCVVKTRPGLQKRVVRGTVAPKLEWAGGTMSAHLDVSPPTNVDAGAAGTGDFYLGRLEGTAGVAEHTHPTSWEIIAAIEANGTFVIDGTEGRLAARQIVMVPPGVKHAWKPEAGSKLVAIQMYSPAGPEQRFVTLAAVKDAGPR